MEVKLVYRIDLYPRHPIVLIIGMYIKCNRFPVFLPHHVLIVTVSLRVSSKFLALRTASLGESGRGGEERVPEIGSRSTSDRQSLQNI